MSIVITGATGGLGSSTLEHLSKILSSSISLIGTTSRDSTAVSPSLRALATFKHADFSSPASLDAAFTGATKVLLVSSPTFNIDERNQQHKNAVDAAKRAGVDRVYYTSLAFGGYGSDSKMGVMASHLWTEEYLKKSGVKYTIIREGFYTDAFPFYLNWYPETTHVKVPGDGGMAWVSREELAEGTARLMLEDGYEDELVLLTGPEAMTLRETTAVLGKALGRDIKFDIVPFEEYVEDMKSVGKSEGLARAWGSTYEGLEKGEGATVDPTLERLLGRKPLGGSEWIEREVSRNKEYRWHQNEHYNGGGSAVTK